MSAPRPSSIPRLVSLLLVGLVAAGGCARDQDPTPAAPATVPPPIPRATVAPMTDVERLDAALATVGLGVDRSIALPGTEAEAFVVVVPGESAIEAWSAARSLVPETGRYPLVVGGPSDLGAEVGTELEQTLASAQYLVDDGSTVETELAAAAGVDIGDWFTSRSSYLEIGPTELEAAPPLPRYDWPKDQFTTNRDILTGDPLPSVEIALLPTSNGWEAPAYLLWGGWNDVPFPHEQVALLRYWHKGRGAEVVAMTGAVIEMTVGSPPIDEDDAVALAREHFLYAPDNVWQGTGDLALLAAALLEAPVWYFWWD